MTLVNDEHLVPPRRPRRPTPTRGHPSRRQDLWRRAGKPPRYSRHRGLRESQPGPQDLPHCRAGHVCGVLQDLRQGSERARQGPSRTGGCEGRSSSAGVGFAEFKGRQDYGGLMTAEHIWHAGEQVAQNSTVEASIKNLRTLCSILPHLPRHIPHQLQLLPHSLLRHVLPAR